MTPDIERTIIQYYPKQVLASPLDDAHVVWDYDSDNATLRAVLADLKALDPMLRNGTRGRYDISEELILFGKLRLQVCYLGPYAALDYGVEHRRGEDERERADRIVEILEAHGITVLAQPDLDELVPWIPLRPTEGHARHRLAVPLRPPGGLARACVGSAPYPEHGLRSGRGARARVPGFASSGRRPAALPPSGSGTGWRTPA